MNRTTDHVDNKRTYPVYVTDITWNSNTIGSYRSKYEKHENAKDLPKQLMLDLQESVFVQANKNKAEFNDVIETFVYNHLTRRFGHEVYHCSIFLPLEDVQ